MGCVVGAVLVDVCLRIGVWLRCARRLAWRENRVVAFFCLSSNGMHQSFPISLALVSHKVCDRLSPALDCLPNGKVCQCRIQGECFFWKHMVESYSENTDCSSLVPFPLWRKRVPRNDFAPLRLRAYIPGVCLVWRCCPPKNMLQGKIAFCHPRLTGFDIAREAFIYSIGS